MKFSPAIISVVARCVGSGINGVGSGITAQGSGITSHGIGISSFLSDQGSGSTVFERSGAKICHAFGSKDSLRTK